MQLRGSRNSLLSGKAPHPILYLSLLFSFWPFFLGLFLSSSSPFLEGVLTAENGGAQLTVRVDWFIVRLERSLFFVYMNAMP